MSLSHETTFIAFKKRKVDEDNGRTRFLSEAEEKAICAKLQKERPELVPAFVLSLHTGMRAGSSSRYSGDQIHWEGRKLHPYKTKNSTARDIDLNAVALDALTTLKAWAGTSPLVHVNEKGESLTRYRDWFNAAVESAGLTDYTWHCNRHTFASRHLFYLDTPKPRTALGDVWYRDDSVRAPWCWYRS